MVGAAKDSFGSVDVLVSRLRRKLTTEGSAPPIVTVRGVGYMFNTTVERS